MYSVHFIYILHNFVHLTNYIITMIAYSVNKYPDSVRFIVKYQYKVNLLQALRRSQQNVCPSYKLIPLDLLLNTNIK